MKLTFYLSLFTIFAMSQTPATHNGSSCSSGEEISLSQFKWENRVLIIFAADQDQESYKSQINFFSSVEEELKDRDLVIISIFDEGCSVIDGNEILDSSASKISGRFKASTQNYSIFLVGKDGGVKLKKDSLLEPEELFRVIDRMPMRQREMRDGR